MRDPFGIHARRVRRGMKGQLTPGDAVEVFARDDVQRDYWVLTSRELVQMHSSGAVRARLPLADAVGSVTQSAAGVSVRLSSRREPGHPLIGAFRAPNDVTRRLAERLDPQRLA